MTSDLFKEVNVMDNYVPQGTAKVSEILSKSTKYFMYGDPDIDGMIAGSFVLNLLKDYGKECTFYVNPNRVHGFEIPLSSMEKYKGYTVIAVDFTMSAEIVKTLVDMGLNVINIDHHEIDLQELFTYDNNGYSGVIINNQYCFEPEEQRFQSGAGMVYHTFKAMFPEYMDTHQNRAFVGMSLLSDVRELESNIAAQYLHALYTWQGEYTDYLINLTKGKYNGTFGVQKVIGRSFMDYSFGPKFNALFRMNMNTEAMLLFNRHFVNINLADVRASQQALSLSMQGKLMAYSANPGLTVMYTDTSQYPNTPYNITNFIGLTCSKVKDNTNGTAYVFLTENGKMLRGSVRGKFDDVDYLTIFRQFGFKAAGHKTAFGAVADDISAIDFVALANAILQAEQEARAKCSDNGKFLKVNNLALAVMNNAQLAVYNNYVRDEKRVVYDCSGCQWKITGQNDAKTFTEFDIDGITVKSFDADLTPANGGYVMPLQENGYNEYYLRKRVR